MTRWLRAVLLAFAAACSGLDEGEGGVVALEIRFPDLATLEVGEQLQLSARPLNAEGDSVAATITWRTPDNTVTVDDTGLVTGVSPGTGRVQASTGSLTSELVSLSIVAPADTLVIVGDSVVIVPVTAEAPTSPDLVVRLDSRSPAGPAGPRPVIYEITAPVAGATPVVQLAGGGQADTLTSGADGTVTGVTIGVPVGVVPPDTAIVAVRSTRTQGEPVPGSGQRFIILFQ